MTDEAKALVEQAAEAIRRRAVETCDADESEQWFAMQFAQAALAGTGVLERLETQAREIERLREALEGLLHMWSSRTVEAARAALKGDSHDQ